MWCCDVVMGDWMVPIICKKMQKERDGKGCAHGGSNRWVLDDSAASHELASRRLTN
jgi:hypothetical protein